MATETLILLLLGGLGLLLLGIFIGAFLATMY